MAEIKRYAIIESATGRIVNIVLWDGESAFAPPEGHELREALADDAIDAMEAEA